MFSSTNRITRTTLLKSGWKGGVCKGDYGTQSDCQSIGYDCLCGLAVALFDRNVRHSSDVVVFAARKEVEESTYSKGFRDGWDGRSMNDNYKDVKEYRIGYEDGKSIVPMFTWRRSWPLDRVGR